MAICIRNMITHFIHSPLRILPIKFLLYNNSWLIYCSTKLTSLYSWLNHMKLSKLLMLIPKWKLNYQINLMAESTNIDNTLYVLIRTKQTNFIFIHIIIMCYILIGMLHVTLFVFILCFILLVVLVQNVSFCSYSKRIKNNKQLRTACLF